MTEGEMLHEMLSEAYSHRLSTKEEKAFKEMLMRLYDKPDKPLSEKQREWIHNVAERLRIRGIGPRAKNLFSSLPEHEQKEHLARAAAVKLPWERGEPRPLKPPGRQ